MPGRKVDVAVHNKTESSKTSHPHVTHVGHPNPKILILTNRLSTGHQARSILRRKKDVD